ncbi:Bug family tripartite tricarboxylate transporter substrate binding protein [Halomonas elongata]|uniref:TTT family transporter substrate-binding protein n=1 Tax=Halomonas elongata (strain ATCC 33173 / DSM 2581 / NBRC 15536 / NCIMB 2198 / 1H9) TaxID=768066 RepID=E1V4W9_HALED|nr:tripartite tricarboxylate transporter substrate-binding protein [Halomonas elongata]MDL4864402.1 tripartite tricarboxylate transporter substrate-binding protein [Halomonas elongata]WBF18256.1 tripartite tricarboxylate transporter substrate binding protein [Halomonas elongata]WPU47108.1 tripartite tricarboxylate transporter substrate-binding protein [Halomonas elongata DSM 2581]CBV41018.1 TTT family transporter substrate-binding protein [Halomonas elongata DSM 2581]
MPISTHKTLRSLGASAVLGLGLAISLPSQALPIDECIAPADPGGGWDFTCRSVGKLMRELDLVDGSVQVTNMPGGVGAVAFSNVAGKRADDSNLIVATSTVGVTQIAQGRYPGGADTMRWLAMLGTDVGVILVDDESPYETLDQLLQAIVDDPASVAMAGSSGAGGWDHIRALRLAKAAGLPGDRIGSLRWVQFDGGGPAVTQMMGGHVDAVSTDLGEIAGFIESGDVRVLAVLAEEPLPEPFEELPTAVSQGYDVTGYNWRGFYTGGEVSDEDYAAMVDTLKTLYESDEWKDVAAQNGLVPLWRGGKEFNDFVRESIDDVEAISREIGVIQ